jgi:hypothetical protein
MPSPTPRLALPRPLAGEAFIQRTAWSGIFDQLDTYPGMVMCTSTTRPGMAGGLPAWGAAHNGMRIWETDRLLQWRWTGTTFVRLGVLGMLGQAQLATPFSTPATAATVAHSVAVTIPATNVGSTTKRIKVSASWRQVDNGDATTGGLTVVTLRRQPGAVVLQRIDAPGRPNAAIDPALRGRGGSIFGLDDYAVGAATYELCINADATIGGTSTLRASASDPVSLLVEEIGL